MSEVIKQYIELKDLYQENLSETSCSSCSSCSSDQSDAGGW